MEPPPPPTSHPNPFANSPLSQPNPSLIFSGTSHAAAFILTLGYVGSLYVTKILQSGATNQVKKNEVHSTKGTSSSSTSTATSTAIPTALSSRHSTSEDPTKPIDPISAPPTPPPENEEPISRSSSPPPGSRDHPDTIKARIKAVCLATILGMKFVEYLIGIGIPPFLPRTLIKTTRIQMLLQYLGLTSLSYILRPILLIQPTIASHLSRLQHTWDPSVDFSMFKMIGLDNPLFNTVLSSRDTLPFYKRFILGVLDWVSPRDPKGRLMSFDFPPIPYPDFGPFTLKGMVLPYLVVPCLFAGSLYCFWVEQELLGMKFGRSWPFSFGRKTEGKDKNGVEKNTDGLSLIEWRNYVVGPVTEELLFRSCIIAAYSLGGHSNKTLIFGTPLWFCVAHAHHAFEVWNKGGRTAGAALGALVGCLFQFLYTTLFGWIAAALFVYSGSAFPSITAHIFCNTMGLPNPMGTIQNYPHQKWRIWGIYILGIAGFAFGMKVLSTASSSGSPPQAASAV